MGSIGGTHGHHWLILRSVTAGVPPWAQHSGVLPWAQHSGCRSFSNGWISSRTWSLLVSLLNTASVSQAAESGAGHAPWRNFDTAHQVLHADCRIMLSLLHTLE